MIQFARTRTDLFPSDLDLIAAVPPDSLAYKLDFQTALERIGYAQRLGSVLAEAIPPAIVPHGAAYDDISGIATFAFTRSFALDHDERVYLRVRRADDQDGFPLTEDWVGQGARVEQIQVGRFIGERVVGEWQDAQVDWYAPGVFRWTETPLTRFRWMQDGLLFEVASRSEIGTAASRWTSLFMPIILALVSADEASPLIEYTVVEGDTCTEIASRFGTTVGRIVELNSLTRTCVIFSGGTLRVPLPPAFGPMLERDLDCDGVSERLRMIPDPLRTDGELYVGFTLEDIPGGAGQTAFDYATFWTYAIPAVDVEFFGAPTLLSVSGRCPWFLAITGYGGSGEDSGLRIFTWEDEAMVLVLDATGFLFGDFRFIDDGIEFETRRLDYDSDTNACKETITSYAWRDEEFVEVGETVTTGVSCFSSGP
jgi:LysM repeat protein